MEYIPILREAINEAVTAAVKADKVKQMAFACTILEAQLLCEQGDWGGLTAAVEVDQKPTLLTDRQRLT